MKWKFKKDFGFTHRQTRRYIESSIEFKFRLSRKAKVSPQKPKTLGTYIPDSGSPLLRLVGRSARGLIALEDVANFLTGLI